MNAVLAYPSDPRPCEAPAPSIRDAAAPDIPRLVEMGGRFFAASSLATYSTYNPVAVEAALALFIDNPDFTVIVLEADRHVAGMACAGIIPLWYNPAEVIGQEMFFWIEPEHRVPGAAGDLLFALERWIEDQGAVALNMGAVECQRPEALTRWYARQGYAAAERTFNKRLNA